MAVPESFSAGWTKPEVRLSGCREDTNMLVAAVDLFMGIPEDERQAILAYLNHRFGKKES